MSGGPLADRTVFVIGGSSGIGYEIARRAAELGATLVIAGRDPARLARAAERIGPDVATFQLDAHDHGAVEAVFADLPPVDHVVSMVGDSMAGGFLTVSRETMRHVLHSKFWSNWVIGTNAAAKIRAGGSLSFTAGTGARPHEASATYVANLAVGALVQGLAVELAPAIRVNAVAPTFMGAATGFWTDLPPAELEAMEGGFSQQVPLQRLATPDEVASAYLHLISNGFVTGQVLSVDGGVMLTA